MANDIDMHNDIIDLYRARKIKEGTLLDLCFLARYIDGDLEKAEKLKDSFIEKYGYWDNWY